jgi:uncharacterized membrane protein (Fun14 family)
MIVSIVALLLGIINLFLLYLIYKHVINNKQIIDSLDEDIKTVTDWVNYYKKTIEKDIKYLTTALNKKFNKNAD